VTFVGRGGRFRALSVRIARLRIDRLSGALLFLEAAGRSIGVLLGGERTRLDGRILGHPILVVT
jgi:hypothetical protein